METIALKSWIIREVTDEAVTMEEHVDGEPSGEVGEFPRQLLPEDVRSGDRFRVVAQLKRAERDEGAEEDGFSSSVLAEATEALAAAGRRGR